jgi:hypothetical protein
VRPLRTALVAACAGLLALGAASAEAARPFQTGFNQFPTTAFSGSQAVAGFGLVKAAGGSIVKLHLDWAMVGATQPADETDPADPAYNWASFDQLVVNTVANGVRPLVQIDRAPAWASGADARTDPNPAAFGRFAEAAARRYDGTFDPPEDGVGNPLPRVKLWQAWNEPNYARFLLPQRTAGKLSSPKLYRTMVNAFATGVKNANPGNLVMAGGMGPFRQTNNAAPFAFMQQMLCLNSKLKGVKGCGPVKLDIWSTHPYTSGAPTRHAYGPSDASLGDLPDMQRYLKAAVKAKKIVSNGAVLFWIDEFGWDSNPPDPKAIPASLHRRWTAEVQYRLWKAGITALLLHQLADNEWTGACGDPFQSGLFGYAADIANAQPKGSVQAFRFPFVALRESKRNRVWGRTPTSKPATVTVQRRRGSTWRSVGTLKADRYGIFNGLWKKSWSTGLLRARVGTEYSSPFELRKRLPNPFYNPFGSAPPAGGCPPR